MSATVALAVLGSALIHASWNALIKSGSSPLSNSFALSVTWIVISTLALPFVPAPASQSWALLGSSVVVHVTYFWLLAFAYDGGDLSLVYPIARGLPPALVCIAAAVWTEDPVSAPGLLGVLLVSGGIFVLAQGGGARSARLRIALALCIAVLIAAYTLLDGLGARRSGDSLSYVVWLTFAHGWLFALLCVLVRGRGALRQLKGQLLRGSLSGVLAAGGYAIVLWAMTRAPIALVAALRETAVLFATAIGGIVLREPLGRRRIVAAILILLGACAIQLHS